MSELDIDALSPAKRALYELKAAPPGRSLRGRHRADRDRRRGPALPGGAGDVESYWDLLARGIDAVRPIPPDRWDRDGYYSPDPDRPGRMYTRDGAFLDAVNGSFTPFRCLPRESESMDPQQRLLFEVAWEALEAPGRRRERLAGSKAACSWGIEQLRLCECL